MKGLARANFWARCVALLSACGYHTGYATTAQRPLSMYQRVGWRVLEEREIESEKRYFLHYRVPRCEQIDETARRTLGLLIEMNLLGQTPAVLHCDGSVASSFISEPDRNVGPLLRNDSGAQRNLVERYARIDLETCALGSPKRRIDSQATFALSSIHDDFLDPSPSSPSSRGERVSGDHRIVSELPRSHYPADTNSGVFVFV